jgi:hypothetical protein
MNVKTAIKFTATGGLAVLGARAADAIVGDKGGAIVKFLAQIAGGAAGAFLAAKLVG